MSLLTMGLMATSNHPLTNGDISMINALDIDELGVLAVSLGMGHTVDLAVKRHIEQRLDDGETQYVEHIPDSAGKKVLSECTSIIMNGGSLLDKMNALVSLLVSDAFEEYVSAKVFIALDKQIGKTTRHVTTAEADSSLLRLVRHLNHVSDAYIAVAKTRHRQLSSNFDFDTHALSRYAREEGRTYEILKGSDVVSGSDVMLSLMGINLEELWD